MRLLVSVRSAEEVAAALAGGADIIDAKEPARGSLGAVTATVLSAIAARTPRPGAGLELIASSGGFAYSRPSPGSAPHAGLPPFSVIGIEKGTGGYLVTIKEGWVIERKPKSEDTPAVKLHSPKAGDKTLDSIPRPQIAMSIGDTLWCKFTTDMMGEITVGHLNVGGGDVPDVRTIQTGLLGADYRIENGRYRFARIYDGENWNPDLRAPLTQPGVNV